MDTETWEYDTDLVLANWPTGQICSTLGFCGQTFIGIEPHTWLLTLYGWFFSGVAELSSRDGEEMTCNTWNFDQVAVYRKVGWFFIQTPQEPNHDMHENISFH